jgi:ubiquinone/menaquinone biosynthesis C-methylase UbiE
MDPAMARQKAVDAAELDRQVKEMYTRVALAPGGEFHFELGRPLAERLGYMQVELDGVPAEAVQSFAGVGYYFDLATLRPGDRVVDLGSGSGMDTFMAAQKVGPGGQVTGIDMTDAQLAKAERLRQGFGFETVQFRKASIAATELSDASWDAVISNGVINLSPDKAGVFREAARLLRPGGRLAVAAIVTDVPLPDNVVCNATLWAACIGGAMQRDAFVDAIEQAGFAVTLMKANDEYRFLSPSAQGATRTYGVRSVSLLAIKN